MVKMCQGNYKNGTQTVMQLCCIFSFEKQHEWFYNFVSLQVTFCSIESFQHFSLNYVKYSQWKASLTHMWLLLRSLPEMFYILLVTKLFLPSGWLAIQRVASFSRYTIIFIYGLLWWYAGDWELQQVSRASFAVCLRGRNHSFINWHMNIYDFTLVGEYTVSYFSSAFRKENVVLHHWLK